MDPQMMPPHFQGAAYPHMKKHDASASPPMPNGVPYHPGYAAPRGHTPQPQMGSRPASRNDGRRLGPMMPPQPSPQPPVNGYAYMPNPAVYPPQSHSPMPAHNLPPQHTPHTLPPQHPPQYAYPTTQPQPTPPQVHTPLPPQYVEEQHRSSMPPSYPPQGPHLPPVSHAEPSPRTLPQLLPPQAPPAHMSPPQPQPQQQEPQPQPPPRDPQPPAPVEPSAAPPPERPRVPLLNTSDAIKRQPQRKQHSIFTPIDENRSILSQHLASFAPEPERIKAEPRIKNEPASRSQSMDVPSVTRNGEPTRSPPEPQRGAAQMRPVPRVSIPETTFSPPPGSGGLKSGGVPSRGRPQLTVQIPDEASEHGGGSPTAPSASPRGAEPPANAHRLPPPSPSGPALLSAGATGPPNPFARPPPRDTTGGVGVETPVSALPSRFLNSDLLPSPSSFYPDWNFRGGGGDSNTLPSPLNFATPVVGTGPSFLREEGGKRKSPEGGGESPEAKRVRGEREG